MNRCSPVETRKNLESAKILASVGLDFVCIPVSDKWNKNELILQLCEAMEVLARQSEEDESIAENNKFLSELD